MGAMEPFDGIEMTEAERLDNLAELQRLKRRARLIHAAIEKGADDLPEDIDEILWGELESWQMTKLVLESDRGPFAHIGREYLADGTGDGSSTPEDEPVGQAGSD